MRIGVIGCGKMGTALTEGAVRFGVIAVADVIGVDPSPEARSQFGHATGARAVADLTATADCEVILLCVKPMLAQQALREVTVASAGKPVLVISIAAGITTAALEAAVTERVRIIRAMPNTPALVGKGAAGYCLGKRATRKDAETARLLLGSVGLAVEVPERLMDAVTGLSGSGPAYAYLIIEALADGGVLVGMTRPEAVQLAAQAVLGAAAMVLETDGHPAALKDMVTSPGGTAIAGLAELERHGVRAALMDAVRAATARATELGS